MLVEETVEQRYIHRNFRKDVNLRTCLKVIVGKGWQGVCRKLWEGFLIHPGPLAFPR